MNRTTITIEEHEYGIAIYSKYGIPLSIAPELMRAFGDEDAILAIDIANKLGANFVVSTKENAAKWRAELEEK